MKKLIALIKLHCEAGTILEHMDLFDEFENLNETDCMMRRKTDFSILDEYTPPPQPTKSHQDNSSS